MVGPMPSTSWMGRSYLRLRSRSKLLQEAGRQLQNYERFPQGQNIMAVRESLKNWMASKERSWA
jgi:hypothetical protein